MILLIIGVPPKHQAGFATVCNNGKIARQGEF